MELIDLEEAVENMILQHDYPGYEARALKIALPMAFTNAPAKVYAQALESSNVYVKLAALRWFQARAGLAKKYSAPIGALLESSDGWVKTEALRTLAICRVSESKLILKILPALKDSDQMVRIEAAKALGNLGKEISKQKSSRKSNIENDRKNESSKDIKEQIIAALQEASEDKVIDVRRKAIKSLRKLDAFSTS